MIPESLTDLRQWVCVYNKCPYDPKKQATLAKVNDPSTWGSYGQVLGRSEDFSQIGFVLHDNDIVGIDIDTGVDELGVLNEWCCEIIDLCHSYTELSQSGRGVHIFVKGTLPSNMPNLTNNDPQHHLEIASNGKYFVMTENALLDCDIVENQPAIDYLLANYFNSIYKEPFYKAEYRQPSNGAIPLAPIYPNIPQGARHNALLSYGGHLMAQGYEASEIYVKLLKQNSEKCKPPLDRKEVDSIFKSVMKYDNTRGQDND